LHVNAFVNIALSANLAEATENLVQPGGANYDWSVLHCLKGRPLKMVVTLRVARQNMQYKK